MDRALSVYENGQIFKINSDGFNSTFLRVDYFEDYYYNHDQKEWRGKGHQKTEYIDRETKEVLKGGS